MKIVDTASDPWHLSRLAPSSAHAHRWLDLEQWLAARRTWPAGVAAGVVLPNDADVEALADALQPLALVALTFPKWTNGRAYSQARLLRTRLRLDSEIRAVGDVLVDMLPLLQRTGFDSVELRPDQSVSVARRSLGFFDRHYQDALLSHPEHDTEKTA